MERRKIGYSAYFDTEGHIIDHTSASNLFLDHSDLDRLTVLNRAFTPSLVRWRQKSRCVCFGLVGRIVVGDLRGPLSIAIPPCTPRGPYDDRIGQLLTV